MHSENYEYSNDTVIPGWMFAAGPGEASFGYNNTEAGKMTYTNVTVIDF